MDIVKKGVVYVLKCFLIMILYFWNNTYIFEEILNLVIDLQNLSRHA